jgi:UDP-sulfoquinovose synthase
MQSAFNYPLTIHGTGQQVRPFININNTADCILLAAENRKKFNEVKIYNQLTETFKLIHLAKKIKKITNCKIAYLKNPRIESERNTLIAKPVGLIELGLKPILLSDDLIKKEIEVAKENHQRLDLKKIIAKSQWKI